MLKDGFRLFLHSSYPLDTEHLIGFQRVDHSSGLGFLVCLAKETINVYSSFKLNVYTVKEVEKFVSMCILHRPYTEKDNYKPLFINLNHIILNFYQLIIYSVSILFFFY